MRKILLLFLITLISCSKKENSFYKGIINSSEGSKQYLVFDIDSDVFKGTVVAKSFRLLQYYQSKNKNITKEEYGNQVYNKLIKKESFDITDKKFIDEYFFKQYKPVKEVDSVAKLGKLRFIEYFFNRDIIKKEFISKTQYSEAAIIKQLFDWEIACHNDSETGYLVITEYERNPNWTIPN